MACTVTSQGETPLEAWQSSHSTRVSLGFPVKHQGPDVFAEPEMLTPVDQPIDKLEDLDQMEM